MRMRGNLSAVEDEWHIRGIAPWVDPVFTFQRTWYPDATPPSVNFNATLAKVFALIGGGLAGYFVWQKTGHKVYTGLAGAAGVIGAPMLVSAYDHFSRPADDEIQVIEESTGTRTDPTLVPGSSASPKEPQITLVTNRYIPQVTSNPNIPV